MNKLVKIIGLELYVYCKLDYEPFTIKKYF